MLSEEGGGGGGDQSIGGIVGDSDDSSAFLGALHDTSSPWTKKTFITGTPVIMKVDTGADVTAISEEDVSFTHPKPLLDVSRWVLRELDGKPLHVLGAFSTPMSINSLFDRSSRCTEYTWPAHTFTWASSDSSTSCSTSSS